MPLRCILVSCPYGAPKIESRTKELVPKICMSSYLYLFYKFRSSAATDKQLSVSLNMMSVHLSAFEDFSNIFIKYRSKQSTSELSLMTFEIISAMVFFPIKKLFLQNKNLSGHIQKA